MREIIDKRYSVLAIDSVNAPARENPAQLVSDSEEYYNNQVMAAARTICESGHEYKFVLLCGPSASGKTTTAHKLKHRIIAQGRGSRVVSMDNFFRGIEHYPLLPDGSPDMESVYAMDMDLLNASFDELMEKGAAKFPIFDFAAQRPVYGAHDISLNPGDILIMEGIHALNPNVLKNISHDHVYRIYCSVRTKFVNGQDTILVPKDIRLMRRMVRDYKFRGHPVEQTLRYWDNVVAAEKVNIDPYRDDVDRKLDNTIDYEVCVWRELLGGLMKQIGLYNSGEYPQLGRIIEGLGHFEQVNYELIPQNSLLREFIGEY
ncbi:MAG: nucleoside kinase [Oscillospiraceae bacterium]|nr:nucleoside kinase [Oscillospiraceae bacterium]